MHEAGLERVHFAWAGPLDPGQAHYYRLHGPTLLIEYDNTQNDANHIHSVWHDPGTTSAPTCSAPTTSTATTTAPEPARGAAPRPPAGRRQCGCPIVSTSLGLSSGTSSLASALAARAHNGGVAQSHPHLRGVGQRNELARRGAGGQAWPPPPGHR